jgi:hypothetical protein
MRIGGGSASWEVISFPGPKDERERLIARLFVEGFDNWVAMESEPSFAPFSQPEQNQENDLDFTVTTSQGVKLMELAEFAPLSKHGPNFANAPKVLDPTEKAFLAHGLVQEKSAHQGGADRFLVLYATEYGFWLDPITIERMRRLLAKEPPNFDRVYFISVHNLNSGSVSEIYPGKPHYAFGDSSDEQLDKMDVMIPHPTEMSIDVTVSLNGGARINAKFFRVRTRLCYRGFGSIKAPKQS